MGFGESFDVKGEVDQIMITFTPCGFLFGVFVVFFFFFVIVVLFLALFLHSIY